MDPRRGAIRIVLRAEANAGIQSTGAIGSAGDFHTTTNGSSEVIFEKLPPDVWPMVSPSVVSDPLSQGIKRAYDPHNILNPGILGD
jgi:FAD/FMN-containing dehydrogenase